MCYGTRKIRETTTLLFFILLRHILLSYSMCYTRCTTFCIPTEIKNGTFSPEMLPCSEAHVHHLLITQLPKSISSQNNHLIICSHPKVTKPIWIQHSDGVYIANLPTAKPGAPLQTITSWIEPEMSSSQSTCLHRYMWFGCEPKSSSCPVLFAVWPTTRRRKTLVNWKYRIAGTLTCLTSISMTEILTL